MEVRETTARGCIFCTIHYNVLHPYRDGVRMCFLENTHDEGEVRILLVEHHTAVREAIAFAFERGAGFEVVAQAASLSEARGMVERIDVAVVDHGLPDGYGCDLIKDLKETNSQAQVFETVGIGGLVPRTDKEILEVVRALNKERSNRGAEPWIHLFGVYRPKIHRQLREFGATSFDSATYFRKAWLRSDQNYLDPDGRSWHAAIRIPMTSDPRTRNRLRANNLPLDELAELEREALSALHEYGDRCRSLEATIEAIKAYDFLLTRSEDHGVNLVPAYERTLTDRPWEKCGCAVCQSIGIDVVIFRGSNRNKRRGVHNTAVLYKSVVGTEATL